MSWIKLETNIFDKQEIHELSENLKISPYEVVAKCCRIWSWFDANTVDGKAKSIMKKVLDKSCETDNFCQGMIEVGWMLDSDGYITLPNYDRHNSKTAKDRALGAKRISKSREKRFIKDGEINIPEEF